MKITGSLLYGVEFGGEVHYDFALRLPTVADNIAAVEETEGPASGLRIEVYMYSRALESLGTIPRDSITYQLLAEQLMPEDLDILGAHVAEVKKKRLRPRSGSAPSDSPSLPSAESESPSPPSAT